MSNINNGGGGGGVTDLQGAYDGGSTIQTAAATGPSITGTGVQKLLNVNEQNASPASAKTINTVDVLDTRVDATTTTFTDDFESLNVTKNYLLTGGATATIEGSVARLSSSVTLIGGSTATNNQNILQISQDSAAEGAHINLENDIAGGTTVDGDLWRSSKGLQYNDGGTEGSVLVPTSLGATGQFLKSTGSSTAPTFSTVPVASLAIGTAGDMIAWDASGDPAIVAPGTTGQVLTAVTGNPPTFQTAAAAAFADWVTAGSGGTYGDIEAALDAGKYNIIMLSNITENSNITPDANGMTLDLNGFILTMGANQIIPAAACKIFIYGDGPASEIDYTATVSSKFFIDTAAVSTTIVTVDNFTYDNNSTAATSEFVNAVSEQHMTRMVINAPNVSDAGVKTTHDSSTFSDMTFVGAGTSCDTAFSLGGGRATNIALTGTFSTTVATFFIAADSIASNVSHVSTNQDIVFDLKGSLTNAYNVGGANLRINVTADDAHLDGAFMNNGKMDLTTSSRFVGVGINSTSDLDMSEATANNNKISASRFTTESFITGNRNKISDVDFLGGAVVESGALNNIITGCQFGADAGAGALTLTLEAGANNNIVNGCISDAIIADNGTTNAVVANITY